MSYDQELHRWKTEAQVALRERNECAREIKRLRKALEKIATISDNDAIRDGDYLAIDLVNLARRTLKDEP